MKTIMAIDPGASGAVAVQRKNGEVDTVKMPETVADIKDVIWDLGFENGDGEMVYIEDVGYHVQGNNASASCKFAKHVGHLEGILTTLQKPWVSVRPQKWMKFYGALPKEKKDRKNKIKELMQRRYPNLKVTLANADALAILTWAIENKG